MGVGRPSGRDWHRRWSYFSGVRGESTLLLFGVLGEH